jgi:hypothetical protein
MKKLLIALATTVTLAEPAHSAGDVYCAEVRKTSDGFLAVRDGPDVKTKLVAMLRSGYPLTVRPANQYLEPEDLKRFPNWTKWVFVRGDFSEDTHANSGHGYVYGKYIKKVPCGPETEPNTSGEALICGPEQGSCRPYKGR